MYSLEVLLVISAVALLFGLGGGALLSRLWFPPSEQRNLEQLLHNSRQEFENYQHEVAKHFVETSNRIGDLTQSYKHLHEHLAQGAATLASPDISRTLLEAASAKEEPKVLTRDDKTIEAPRDWAPKAPGQKGTLSEDYGLHDMEHPEDAVGLDPLHKPR